MAGLDVAQVQQWLKAGALTPVRIDGQYGRSRRRRSRRFNAMHKTVDGICGPETFDVPAAPGGSTTPSTPLPPSPVNYPVLKRGSSGGAGWRWRRLHSTTRAQIRNSGWTARSVPGDASRVLRFQASINSFFHAKILDVDGVIGSQTWYWLTVNA